MNKHNWIGLCSDINTHWSNTYHWYKCDKCGEETESTKEDQDRPSEEGCNPKEGSQVFPLSSI